MYLPKSANRQVGQNVYRKLREFIAHVRDGVTSRHTIAIWSIQEWATRNRRIARVDLLEPETNARETESRTLIILLGVAEKNLPNEMSAPDDLLEDWRREISELVSPQTSLDVRLLDDEATTSHANGPTPRTIYEAFPRVAGGHGIGV